jgi:hypothetical protein
MAEYKIITTAGRFFVTAPSKKHAAIVARQDPRFDGVKIKRIARHKLRDTGARRNQAAETIKCIPSKFLSFNSQQL